ncbi:MAG TPA: S8 family serine peptidase [Chloroflexaceae bacterium]|nr:S8 family serine peptidase [Chloroflexaceae bacterium]
MRRLFAVATLVALTLGLLATPAQAQPAPRSFLILANGSSLPPGLEGRITAAGGAVSNRIPEVGIVVATGDDAFAARARRIAGVRSVVPNFRFQRIQPRMAEGVTLDYGNPPNSGDDDTLFDLQWGHDAIDAPEAWNAGYFGAGARVAVLDEGFDLDHPDLAENIVGSKSFVPGEEASAGYLLPDAFSHGTHVAGTIAAADNGLGVIGVAPKAELVLVKVLSEILGYGEFDWVIQGIVYAAGEADADVINMSLGGTLPRNGGCDTEGCFTAAETAELLVAISRATTYAHRQGTTIIASAGNDANDGDKDKALVHMPSDATHVISISATAPIGWATDPANTFLDNLASYSNFGQSAIDFAAPGGDFVYPGEEPCTIAGLTRPCWVFDFVFSTGSNPTPGLASYYWSVGTSMAAPHAAGVAALIIGKNGGSMHPAQVEAAMRRGADDLGKPGNDAAYGAGRVNAYQSVR